MKNNWFKKANDYFLREISDSVGEKLPNGIYKLNMIPMVGELYLSKHDEKFHFPYKVYGIQDAFIKRVVTTYKATRNNLGILLNGLRGTGKSVTAEIICNMLELPVILIDTPYGGLPDFISKMQNDVIFFFDEYEKTFSKTGSDGERVNMDDYLLTVMDGSLNTIHRKVFILTTNNLWVNENLIQRPGRIRYKKTFKDMPVAIITEIVDDTLIHKEFKGEIIKFIAELEMITVDIVKSVVEEVNIHNEGPSAFKDVFNIDTLERAYNIYKRGEKKDEWTTLYERSAVNPTKIQRGHVGCNFAVDGETIGRIEKVISAREILVRFYNDEGDLLEKTEYIKLEETYAIHESFSEYAF